MRRLPLRALAALGLGACLLTAGCFSLRASDAASFYLLSSMAEQDAIPSQDERATIVGMGPVDVPEYLNRSQIVVRRGPNELQLADFDKWAEPLKDGVARVLAKNVASLVPAEAVFFPWKRNRSIDFQVVVQVGRFDTDAVGSATLDVRWGLYRMDGREELVARSDTYRVEAEGIRYADRVGAMSLALADFSMDIAAALSDHMR